MRRCYCKTTFVCNTGFPVVVGYLMLLYGIEHGICVIVRQSHNEVAETMLLFCKVLIISLIVYWIKTHVYSLTYNRSEKDDRKYLIILFY